MEKLSEKQAEDARLEERKQAVSTQLERELHETLESRSWEVVLSHFGAASYKQALVQFHPDRAPPGTSFEEIVWREVVFKYVQMRHDRASLASDGSVPRGCQPDNESRRKQRDAEAQSWQRQQAREAAGRARAHRQEAAEEAKRSRNVVPKAVAGDWRIWAAELRQRLDH